MFYDWFKQPVKAKLGDDQEVELDRVVAGLVWPGERPGVICVVGQEALTSEKWWADSERKKGRPYHLVREMEERDLGLLIRYALELRKTFQIQAFYSRYHKPAADFLNERNRKAYERGRPQFQYLDVPYGHEPASEASQGLRTGRIEVHLRLLRELLVPGRKRLHLGLKSRLGEELLSIGTAELPTLTDMDTPACGALAYAVVALEYYGDIGMEDAEVAHLNEKLLEHHGQE